ncbi:MAG: type 1 glutamine amidotransferase [Phycisphaerales bacterium]
MARGPLIGITVDVIEEGGRTRAILNMSYAESVAAAGGVPVLLPPIASLAGAHAAAFDGFVLTGGDDVRMEAFGEPTHPAAKPIHPLRQEYELALLDALRDARPAAPVLGVCLGMQLMSVHAGARLEQHLPERLPTAGQHKGEHAISPLAGARGPLTLSAGPVASSHHQAVSDPGPLTVLAKSGDGVIEAVTAAGRKWYVGVQWHPERTADRDLGLGVFRQLVNATREVR